MNSSSSPGYDPRSFPPVAVTVDVVLFTIREDALHVLLIERGVEPFLGSWALPGGFVQPGEDLDAAAARELAEETGVGEDEAYLEQLATYGSPERDPRMRVISVAYWAACESLANPAGGGDAARAALVPVSWIEDGGMELAFDHERIAKHALDRLRAKLEYTAVAARFCHPEFTISELRTVYETVWNTKLDPGNFQRKVRENLPFRKVDPTVRAMASPLRRSDTDSARNPVAFSVAASVDSSASGAIEAEALPLSDQADSTLREEREAGPMHQIAWDPSPLEAPAPTMPISRRATMSPGSRGGRPPSLWTAVDPGLMLNSPIPRRRYPASGESG